jgi:hypothetical protein
MREEVPEHVVEVLLALPAVAVPPDRVLGQRVDLGVLVLGRAAGVMTGLGAERAARDDGGFPVPDCVLVKRRLGQIPMDRAEVFEAEFVGAEGGITQTEFFHRNSSSHLRLPHSQNLTKSQTVLDAPRRRSATHIVGGLLVAIMTAAKTNPCCGRQTGIALIQVNASLAT